MSDETYAWYMYPEPDGKPYSEQDLKNPVIVQEVFDFCQINLAAILAEGWQFLFSHYSIEALAEIDKKSGWFQPCTAEEFKESLEYHSLISGYDPNTNVIGKYNEKTNSVEPKS